MDRQTEFGGADDTPRRIPSRVERVAAERVTEVPVVVEPVVVKPIITERVVVTEPVVVREVEAVEEVKLVPLHQDRVLDKKPITEEAKVWWKRAKAGFEKTSGIGEGEHFEAGHHVSHSEHLTEGHEHVTKITGSATAGVVNEPVVVVEEEDVQVAPGLWERIVDIVPGVASFHGTGRADHSAGRAGETEGFWNEDPFDPRKPKHLADVVHDATEEAAGLLHAEMALAKVEIKERLKVILPALVLFIAAIGILLYAIGVLIFAAISALALLVPFWAAGLIMALLMLAVAALLVFIGLKRFKALGHKHWLFPETLKDDITALTSAFKTRNWANDQEKIKEGRL